MKTLKPLLYREYITNTGSGIIRLAPFESTLTGVIDIIRSTDASQSHNAQMSTTRLPEGHRLAKLTKICLALPETARCDSGSHAAFLVGKRTFAYFLNDHHGDGIVSVACKALPGDNRVLAAAQRTRFLSARVHRIERRDRLSVGASKAVLDVLKAAN